MIELFLAVLAYFFIGLIGLAIIFEVIRIIVLIISFLVALFISLPSWAKAAIGMLLVLLIL